MKHEFLAKSSSGEPYKVVFYFKEDVLTARCGCQAGKHRQLCKHIVALLNSDVAILYDSAQAKELSVIDNFVKQVGCRELIMQYADIAKEMEVLDKKKKTLKKRIGLIMKEGIKA